MQDKLKALFESRRFLFALATLLTAIANDVLNLGIDEDLMQSIVVLVASWVVGDSIRKTDRKRILMLFLCGSLVFASLGAFSGTAVAAENYTYLDLGNATPGTYPLVLTIREDGTVLIKPVQVVKIDGTPSPPPDDDDGDDDPPPPDEMTLADKVSNWAKATGDPNTPNELAEVYKWLADQIEAGVISGPDAVKAVSVATDRLTQGQYEAKWNTFRDHISDELAERLQDGSLSSNEDYQQFFEQVADGLDDAVAGAVDPKRILEIVQMIIEILQQLGLI